ncbi:hypothetical protein MOSE0_E04302 [Monosporozyma servazzii]
MNNTNDHPTKKYIPKHKQKDDKLNNDILRISQAMDAMAKLIIEKRKQAGLNNNNNTTTEKKTEYDMKLKKLNDLINMILNLNNNDTNNNNSNQIPHIMDETKLDELLRDEIEFIEREGQSYALIPVKMNDQTTNNDIIDNATIKKNKKKKKNKILCSFCHEPGHTRAHCEQRLYNNNNNIH